MDTPVALFVFNRPETTARVFEAIRSARPRHLLVVADGPRTSRPGEEQRVAAVRALLEKVDWDCDVARDYASSNLGCRARVSSGLDWVFDRHEAAIILEDDCVPHPSFFPFCEQLLARYRDEPRVMAITGDNFQGGRRRGSASYYFSRFMHVWGWATWRRAWRHYDVSMASWPGVRAGRWLVDHLGDRAASRYWAPIFDQVHSGRIDTWDYQWLFAIWRQGGLVATPNVNLVDNIGIGVDATHTGDGGSRLQRPAAGIPLPLKHPREISRDAAADRFVQRREYFPPWSQRVLASLARRWRSLPSLVRRPPGSSRPGA